MGDGAVSRSRILELVPEERLAGYLESVRSNTGLDVVMLDDDRTELACPCDGQRGTVDPALWDRLCALSGDGPGEVSGPDGVMLMRTPVCHRGSRLGWLTASARETGGAGVARAMLGVMSANIETLAESGYEVESLTCEVVRIYDELAMIFSITARLGALVDVVEICRVIAEEAEKVHDASDVFVQLVDRDGESLRTAYALGEHEAHARSFSPGLREGLLGKACVGHRTVLVCEVDEDKQHTGWPYPIRRLLVVPLIAEGRVLGVIVSTDKRDGSEFNTREEKLLSAMASVAAIAIKNAQLYSDIKALLEGFINASVTAVEYRDPTTAGHSERVAKMSVELARQVGLTGHPDYKDVSFSDDNLRELYYAGLLHDFGKIGVKESILLKGGKLYPEQMGVLKARFWSIKERKMREAAEKKLALVVERGPDAMGEDAAQIDDWLASELARLDELLNIVEMADNPRVLLTEVKDNHMLDDMVKEVYSGPDGEEMPMLTYMEYESLKVLKGSLNAGERREVESHVEHSHEFLSRVPWTKGFSGITDIVHAHHEMLDGSGYPKGLKAGEIPLMSRIMAVADVFDALTAWDRPYKDAVSTQKALFILDMEAGRGRLDAYLVQIFRDAKVYSVLKDETP